jgi:hypothetical protein
MPQTKTMTRAGWALTLFFGLFMLGASVLPELAGMAVAQETMSALGWPDFPVFHIGVLELVLTLLVLWPRTMVLGAVLMMGLLGGAMATQIRADMPLMSHVLFPVYLGTFMWGGIWLRCPRLRALLPLRS